LTLCGTRGEEFSEEKNESLYRRFFGEKDENELKKIREDLQQILATILREVTELTGQTEEYESFISNTVSTWAKDTPAEEIRNVVSEILEKTKTLVGFGKTLRHSLTETTETLETLKHEFEQVKTQAFVDFLTGVPNRKAFDETLTKLTGEATSDNKDLSILIIDIDHFKRFNDEHGHLIGDEVLRFVAKRIKEIVRGRDFLARFRGEEFTLILPETPMAGATVVAESIRSFFAQATLKEVATSKKLGKITVSIDVACYQPGEPAERFINRSDQALYLAKNNGRNRIATE
jgi:diguanylate cyclase